MFLKLASNRICWFFVKPIRTCYRFLFRPKSRAVKIVVKSDDSYLLVRPTYAHRQWTLPGGAVEHGETFEQAAYRELLEETGIVAESLTKIGDYQHTRHYLVETVECFSAAINQQEIKADGLEIKEVAWFKQDQLPDDRSIRVDEILGLFSK